MPTSNIHILDFFFVRYKNRFCRIDTASIQYIMATAHNSKIHTDNGMFWPHLQLKSIENALPESKFARINRTTIVALNRIEWYTHDEVSLNGISFTLTKNQRDIFYSKISTLIHEELKQDEIDRTDLKL